jgi:hypothetical protein
MHPDMARDIIRQHTEDMRAQARRDKDARTARAAARKERHRAKAQVNAVIPPIPDYVDGTFRETGDHAHADA